MVWIGRDLKDQPPCPQQGDFPVDDITQGLIQCGFEHCPQ